MRALWIVIAGGFLYFVVGGWAAGLIANAAYCDWYPPEYMRMVVMFHGVVSMLLAFPGQFIGCTLISRYCAPRLAKMAMLVFWLVTFVGASMSVAFPSWFSATRAIGLSWMALRQFLIVAGATCGIAVGYAVGHRLRARRLQKA